MGKFNEGQRIGALWDPGKRGVITKVDKNTDTIYYTWDDDPKTELTSSDGSELILEPTTDFLNQIKDFRE